MLHSFYHNPRFYSIDAHNLSFFLIIYPSTFHPSIQTYTTLSFYSGVFIPFITKIFALNFSSLGISFTPIATSIPYSFDVFFRNWLEKLVSGNNNPIKSRRYIHQVPLICSSIRHFPNAFFNQSFKWLQFLYFKIWIARFYAKSFESINKLLALKSSNHVSRN